MAGGKISPRQKMINLMYLVFIAMLALNMSKEVLSAFGSINTKLNRANVSYTAKNNDALVNLKTKAGENEGAAKAAMTAQKASDLSKVLFDFLGKEKENIYVGNQVEDREAFESMDKTQYLDETYYKGGKVTPSGQAYLDQIDAYRNGMVALIGDDNQELVAQIQRDFSTEDIKIVKKGNTPVTKDYINYHFVGFPMVSSITKMTQMQNDIKVVENELMSKLLTGNLKALTQISDQNYSTVMTQKKGAFYTGETFDGMISLGRVDESTKPEKVELLVDGRPIGDRYDFEGGRVKLKVGSGSVGQHKITGNLIFIQDGKEVKVPVDQKFTTINKPNSAIIAADKMNVVYRGVQNPMTISFAGIQDNKVNASGQGLKKKNGSSYMMSPGNGKEVTISVTGTLPDGGGSVSDKATFRIKDIPRPTGTMRNDDSGNMKMSREAVGSAPVGAVLVDFDFDLKLDVSSFKFKAPGAATVLVNGRKLNPAAKSALKKAKRGAAVQIFDIKAKIKGNSGYRLRKVSPVIIELTN